MIPVFRCGECNYQWQEDPVDFCPNCDGKAVEEIDKVMDWKERREYNEAMRKDWEDIQKGNFR